MVADVVEKVENIQQIILSSSGITTELETLLTRNFDSLVGVVSDFERMGDQRAAETDFAQSRAKIRVKSRGYSRHLREISQQIRQFSPDHMVRTPGMQTT